MRKRKKTVSNENHERYLLTYSDLVTLLLVFFIVLYAMSDVNEEKYSNLATSLQGVFQNEQSEPGAVGEETSQVIPLTPEESMAIQAIKEQQYLQELKRNIDQQIKERGLEQDIQTSLYDAGLKIVLTNKILFNSGEAVLKKESKSVISAISQLINDVKNPIQINGYTDNIPISTFQFPSNWELSSARAISVLKQILQANNSLNPEIFSATGYGEHHSISTNETKIGREKNRRVEIIIERRFEK